MKTSTQWIRTQLFVAILMTFAVGCAEKADTETTQPAATATQNADQSDPKPRQQLPSDKPHERRIDEPISPQAFPIPNDFSDELEKSISTANYKKELAALEAEISSDT